jgi:hypothetical protein
MPMAIAEINQEYSDRLTEIRNDNAHDEVQMSGTRANWKEVLAVYAVKVNTDPDNAQDVATMDEDKKELLRSVFWDMNVLSHRTETKEVTEVSVVDDGNEDFTSTETTVTNSISVDKDTRISLFLYWQKNHYPPALFYQMGRRTG